MLGDAYGAAIVEALSKKELEAMDRQKELDEKKALEEEMERGHNLIVRGIKKVMVAA